ncbi:MAG: hypothetical protein ACJ71D_13955 [Nitrososphaera sp.]
MTDSSATSHDPGMAIKNSLLKELGDYKKLVQALKTDARYTYPHVKELTQSHDLLSQHPRIRKKFNRLLNDSKKRILQFDSKVHARKKGRKRL